MRIGTPRGDADSRVSRGCVTYNITVYSSVGRLSIASSLGTFEEICTLIDRSARHRGMSVHAPGA
jgi:hypothetical protein